MASRRVTLLIPSCTASSRSGGSFSVTTPSLIAWSRRSTVSSNAFPARTGRSTVVSRGDSSNLTSTLDKGSSHRTQWSDTSPIRLRRGGRRGGQRASRRGGGGTDRHRAAGDRRHAGPPAGETAVRALFPGGGAAPRLRGVQLPARGGRRHEHRGRLRDVVVGAGIRRLRDAA